MLIYGLILRDLAYLAHKCLRHRLTAYYNV